MPVSFIGLIKEVNKLAGSAEYEEACELVELHLITQLAEIKISEEAEKGMAAVVRGNNTQVKCFLGCFKKRDLQGCINNIDIILNHTDLVLDNLGEKLRLLEEGFSIQLKGVKAPQDMVDKAKTKIGSTRKGITKLYTEQITRFKQDAEEFMEFVKSLTNEEKP